MDFKKELAKFGYNKGNMIDVDTLIEEVLPKLFSKEQNNNLYSEEEILENLKAKLEVKAGVICEPLLKLAKNPKEDEEVKKVFLTLAHLEEVISYFNQNKKK